MSDTEPVRKLFNMIWANESGVSVYIYEGEHDRRIIEIHGVVKDYETVLATATIEKHNRNRVAQALEFPNRTEEFNKRYNVSDKDLEDLSKTGRIVQSDQGRKGP